MSKYFKNCQSLKELRKDYLKLIKQYHPDLARNECEIKERSEICKEINSEYELLCKRLPKSEETHREESNGIQEQVAAGNIDARNACLEVADRISKLPIDYKFYHTLDGAKWWEDQVSMEIDSTAEIFWDICLSKKIIGSEFAKLFELCDSNVEKMRRTVMFLSTGAISEKDIHTNLTSDNAIPFFDKNIVSEKLPDYNSFLLLGSEVTRKETLEAWTEFCQRQRDVFSEKFYDIVVPRLSTGTQK